MNFAGRLGILLLILGMTFAPAANADPILLNFDELTPGLKNGGTYAALGVVIYGRSAEITSGGIVIGGVACCGFGVEASSDAGSPPNIAYPLERGLPFVHGHGFSFLNPNTGRNGGTDFLSFAVVGTQSGLSDPWYAVILGEDAQPLEIVSGTTNRTVTFMRNDRDLFYALLVSNGAFAAVDDLSFNTPAVPEPSTIVLFGSGLVAVARFVRRRRSSG